ncbi:MAG: GntR family transcriptional regulator [Natronospirillum sp.]|uniref:GntR family transcriptional regulator n=1 Tax=Natronospirillum sp. TaxID=2812955 RepID=UPI0025DB507E|nr:GntR family transcriptional regulator [Natronospirillum sp.]MCH8552377.1 GntR family transcriptional regulator [Natronospirillum sp.]
MKKIQTGKSLPELIYDSVVNAIVEGLLKPGERVTQETLAARLDVSRLPVSQAMQRLRDDGFLSAAGRRGLMVSVLDESFVAQLYEFRGGIDLISAGLAAQRADAAARERGAAIIAQGRAAGKAHDLSALIDADMRFHSFIYELAGNRFILDSMEAHWNHVRRVMRDILIVEKNQQQIWDEHEAILNAVLSGDVQTAELLARQHVETASDWLQREIQSCSEPTKRSGNAAM